MENMDKVEKTANVISMVATLVAGVLFIFQGFRFLNMKARQPELSGRVYTFAVVCFVVGIFDIIVGIAHIYI